MLVVGFLAATSRLYSGHSSKEYLISLYAALESRFLLILHLEQLGKVITMSIGQPTCPQPQPWNSTEWMLGTPPIALFAALSMPYVNV